MGPYGPFWAHFGPFGAHRGLNRVGIDPNRPEMGRIWTHGALWGPKKLKTSLKMSKTTSFRTRVRRKGEPFFRIVPFWALLGPYGPLRGPKGPLRGPIGALRDL